MGDCGKGVDGSWGEGIGITPVLAFSHQRGNRVEGEWVHARIRTTGGGLL